MSDDALKRLIMDVAAEVANLVEVVYQRELADALADNRALLDMIEAHGDEHMIAAARDVVARRQPDRRAWYDCPPAGHA